VADADAEEEEIDIVGNKGEDSSEEEDENEDEAKLEEESADDDGSSGEEEPLGGLDEEDSLSADEDEEGFGSFQHTPQQRLTSRQRAIIDRRDRGEPDEQGLLVSLPMGTIATSRRPSLPGLLVALTCETHARTHRRQDEEGCDGRGAGKEGRERPQAQAATATPGRGGKGVQHSHTLRVR
jgi:hypothetical protein